MHMDGATELINYEFGTILEGDRIMKITTEPNTFKKNRAGGLQKVKKLDYKIPFKGNNPYDYDVFTINLIQEFSD